MKYYIKDQKALDYLQKNSLKRYFLKPNAFSLDATYELAFSYMNKNALGEPIIFIKSTVFPKDSYWIIEKDFYKYFTNERFIHDEKFNQKIDELIYD